MDTETGELWKEGEEVHLQDKPFQVLVALLDRSGEIVERSELRKTVWADQTYLDFDHSINIAISKLREALEDSSHEPRLIETVPRRGYRFIGQVRESTAEASSRAALWRWTVGVVALVIALGVVLVGLQVTGHFRPSQEEADANVLGTIDSLAVLPLRNVTGRPDYEYVAEGVTEAIISELGGVSSLRVISWQSVVRFKNSSDSLPDIARELDVEGVVLGNVRSSDDRILVAVQLVGIEPERHLWTQEYEEPREKLIEVQRRVAKAIASEIKVAVTPQERKRLERPAPVVPAAYDAYLKGLYFWNQFSKTGFHSAIEQFTHATALDSGFAAAYAGLANSWSMLGWYGYASPHDAFPHAEAAAGRALELDPESAVAHTAMAAVLGHYRWEFSASETHYLRAIELNRSLALAHNWYSWALAQQGESEEALNEARKAQRLDPMSLATNATVGFRLYDARRYDEAIGQLNLSLGMNRDFLPAMMFLGMTYERVGLHEKAIEILERAVTGSGGAPAYEALLASALAADGQREAAEAALARVLGGRDRCNAVAFPIAVAFVSLGDFDRAFEWLERGYETRCPWIPRIAIEPLLDPIRDDVRFAELRRRVGI